MAKYEHFRTYVVAKIDKKNTTVAFTAPKGRSFRTQYVFDVPKKVLAGLKAGQKVKFVRVSTPRTTYYVPRFK